MGARKACGPTPALSEPPRNLLPVSTRRAGGHRRGPHRTSNKTRNHQIRIGDQQLESPAHRERFSHLVVLNEGTSYPSSLIDRSPWIGPSIEQTFAHIIAQELACSNHEEPYNSTSSRISGSRGHETMSSRDEELVENRYTVIAPSCSPLHYARSPAISPSLAHLHAPLPRPPSPHPQPSLTFSTSYRAPPLRDVLLSSSSCLAIFLSSVCYTAPPNECGSGDASLSERRRTWSVSLTAFPQNSRHTPSNWHGKQASATSRHFAR